jgi:hypothetical protein
MGSRERSCWFGILFVAFGACWIMSARMDDVHKEIARIRLHDSNDDQMRSMGVCYWQSRLYEEHKHDWRKDAKFRAMLNRICGTFVDHMIDSHASTAKE